MEAIHNLLGGCQPITEEEINKVFNEISIRLNELGLKFCALGSFNKKKEGELYNDLDIAIEMPFDNGLDIVKKICLDNEDTIKFGKSNDKFNTVSIGYKINDEYNAQVDFMFCDNIEFAAFAFHSPNFKLDESKYKGMYASILLQSIIRNIPIRKTYFEDGTLKEWSYYSLSQKDGLHKKTKTFLGAKGNRIKNPKLLENEFITNNPNEIISIISEDIDFETVWSFEKLLDYISLKYDKNFIGRVKHDFLTDWEFKLKTPDELKKEFEDLFNDKINNL